MTTKITLICMGLSSSLALNGMEQAPQELSKQKQPSQSTSTAIQDKPLVKPRTTFCAHCTKPAKETCGGCLIMAYCSRECQKLDWKAHKPNCLTMCKCFQKDLAGTNNGHQSTCTMPKSLTPASICQLGLKLFEENHHSCQNPEQKQSNLAKAHTYLMAAFNQHDDLAAQGAAEFALGEMYLEGAGVVQDYEHARKHFLSVIEHSLDIYARSYSCLYLGKMYVNGQGIAIDLQEAFKHFTAASQQQENKNAQIEAKICLAQMLLKGDGIKQNYKSAHELFLECAEQSSNNLAQIMAWIHLGRMHLKGEGVSIDTHLAFSYFEKVASQDRDPVRKARALFYMAQMLELGENGFLIDLARAATYYHRVVNQNDDLQVKGLAQERLMQLVLSIQ